MDGLGNASALDLFELLDDDSDILNGVLGGSGLNLPLDSIVGHGHGGESVHQQAQPTLPGQQLQQGQYFSSDVYTTDHQSLAGLGGPWQPQWTAGQQDTTMAGADFQAQPHMFSSAEAATRYADTTALVAAAQARMDASSPTHGAALQLQSVVSAASIQLQKMVQAEMVASKLPPAQRVAAHVPASAGWPAQQQQPVPQFNAQPWPPSQQQQQQQSFQQQQFQQQQFQQAASLQQQQQLQQLQQQQLLAQQVQPQQQMQPQQMAPPQQQQQQQQGKSQPMPSFSAATMAKAAAIAGQAGNSQMAAPPASTPFSMTGAQSLPGGLPPLPMTNLTAAQSMPDPSMLLYQRLSSSGLDPATAAAATAAAVSSAMTSGATAGQQQQMQGLQLPDQFKGVMLTPAGPVTGVAVGPNLVQWVQGLQHLASQQKQAQAARNKAKAARKKDKVQDLQAELAEKQEQLQTLSLENLALVAKARALEQLVKSAGDDVTLMEEQLASLSLKQETQEDSKQAAEAAAAAVAALQGQATWSQQVTLQQKQQAMQQQQQQHQQHQQPFGVLLSMKQEPPQQQLFQQQQQQQQQRSQQAFQQPQRQQQRAPNLQPQVQQQQQPAQQPIRPPQQQPQQPFLQPAQQQPFQQPSQQQQQQQQQPQSSANFTQLHQQVLQNLLETPLESLEDILGGLMPAAAHSKASSPQLQATSLPLQQQPAAAAGAGVQAGAAAAAARSMKPTDAGFVAQRPAVPPAAAAQQQQQQQQQQEQMSPQQILYQQWSPPLQQQQTSDASGGTHPLSSGGQAATSGAASSAQQDGDDISSPLSNRAGSSMSDLGRHGDLYGTAASVAAAAQAAAAGVGGGLLLAGRMQTHQQLFEAAAMALPNAYRPTQQLEEKLPEIQAVHKRVVLQLMPLLLQVQQERIQYGMLHGLLEQQQELSTPAMQQLTRVMLEYSKDIHTFAIANRVSTYELYTLNIETGVLNQPPPDGHWKRVSGMLKDRLSRQALADLCIARQLYSSTLLRIKQQRQLLVLQLAQLISNAHSRSPALTYRTDAVFQSVSGPHCEGNQLLDKIEQNMRKEYTLEGVYQWMTHHIIPMHVLAELVVHSYPYKADIHMTLQELMRDQPMPALTALQQLQLKQLQEQQNALKEAQQQQQAAAAAALAQQQQQQAAQQYQLLNQQRGLLASGGVAGVGGYGGGMLF